MNLCDTGPLVAILDQADIHHQLCVKTLAGLPNGLITTWACVTEAMHFLGRRYGLVGQDLLWEMLTGGTVGLFPVSYTDAPRLRELMAEYSDSPMDFADATLVVAGERTGIRRVFTLDRHFHAYRANGTEPFEVVP